MDGTKDTKEAMQAILALADFLIERLGDGAGVDDLVAVWSKLTSDDVFMKKIKSGWEGKENISKELTGITTAEITTLGYDLAPDIIAILLKLKKKS
jgi:ketosteroid isomerase-like protein